jgi:hypothetical protein
MLPQWFVVRFARIRTHTRVVMSVAIFGALTAACAATPERLLAGADPSDAAARVAPTGYRPVLGGYVSQRPVAPASWREQNERVAPVRKQ